MAGCCSGCHCSTPTACWVFAHVTKETCGCCVKPCDPCNKAMAQLVIQGFDICNEEDRMFVSRVARENAGNHDATVKFYAKWKTGFKSGWRYKP